MNNKNIMLFSMPNSTILANNIAKMLNLELTPINKIVYADGEINLKSSKTVRNQDVFIICSTCKPVNQNYMELFIFIDSLKRASAKSINVVLTYYGYARQDRKAVGRDPITSALVAKLLESAGISKIITVDLHNPSIQGFFTIPVDEIRAIYLFANYLKNKISNAIVVSPDHGGAIRARDFANLISSNSEIAIIDKSRVNMAPNASKSFSVLGNVKNKNVILIDDMIDTGGTIIKGAKLLKESGALEIYVIATHGIFSNGFEIFENTKEIKKVWITDSVPTVYDIKSSKLEVVSLANFISNVISTMNKNASISLIYKETLDGLNEIDNN